MIPAAFSPAINKVYKYLKRSPASSFFVVSLISRTSTFYGSCSELDLYDISWFYFYRRLGRFIIYQYTAGIAGFIRNRPAFDQSGYF